MAFHIKLGGSISGKHSAEADYACGSCSSVVARAISSMNLKGIKLTWLGHSTFRIETAGR